MAFGTLPSWLQKKPPPSRHSGGTSGDLTIPGYKNKTPIVSTPYDPNEPMSPVQQRLRKTSPSSPSTNPLLAVLNGLLTPGVTLRETAEAASRLGVEPLDTAPKLPPAPKLKALGVDVGRLLGAASSSPKVALADDAFTKAQLHPNEKEVGEHEIEGARPKWDARDLHRVSSLFDQADEAKAVGDGRVQRNREARAVRIDNQDTFGKPHTHSTSAVVDPDPLGKKTLGNATRAQILAAQKAGTLRIDKKGVISTPENRQVLAQLKTARQNAAASNGVTGPLTPAQKQIAMLVSKATGGVLKPATVATQELQEMSGSAAQQRDAEHNYDVLNIGYTDAGPLPLTKGSEWSTPKSAAEATAAFFKGEKYGPSTKISEILDKAKGKSVAEQLQIIGESGWATSAYATDLAATSKLIKEHHDPAAVVALQVAKKTAVVHGINPTPFNGDVAGGGSGFTWVRADAKGMLDWAESAIGITDSSLRTQKLGQRFGLNTVSQPWCANFISNGLLRRGITNLPANPNYVPSFEEWATEGKEATIVQGGLAKAKPGDLVAFSGQHIGVYVGGGEMISGNFGDQVSRDPITADSSPVSMIIRPKYKGGKVKVADAQISGSSATSALGGVGSSEAVATTTGPGEDGATRQELRTAQLPVGANNPLLSPLSLAPEPGAPGEAEEAAQETIARILGKRRL